MISSRTKRRDKVTGHELAHDCGERTHAEVTGRQVSQPGAGGLKCTAETFYNGQKEATTNMRAEPDLRRLFSLQLHTKLDQVQPDCTGGFIISQKG